MGYYLNPKEGKEKWLAANALLITRAEAEQQPPEGTHLVCLVDNGWMTAAGIAYCDDEKQRFLVEDGRSKYWFLVMDSDILALEPNVPLETY